MACKKNKDVRSLPPIITDDLIFYEIFPRLPVKSLHRFRCISTSFHSLTSESNFLTAFRRLSPHYHLLSFSCLLPTRFALYSINFSGMPTSVLARPFTVVDNCTYVKVINGFMCQVNGGCHIIISNPATNEKIQLPGFEPPTEFDRQFFYFCYDPETNDYKVLRTTAIGAYKNEQTTTMTYSIFTLRFDKWCDFHLPELCQFGNSRSVCINGILYLNKFRDIDGHDVIAAFSVKMDCFYAVWYPNGLPRSRYDYCHLVEVKGALAIIDVPNFKRCEIKLWTMEMESRSDDGGFSWVELTIEFDSRWETLFNLSLNCSFSVNSDGEIMMGSTGIRSNYGCWVFIYNMDSKEWRRVEIEGIKNCVILGHLSIEECVESPLLLKQILNPKLLSSLIVSHGQSR